MTDTPPVSTETFDEIEANLRPQESTANPNAPTPTTSDTALAAFRKETLLGAGAEYAYTRWDEHEAAPDPSFHPYQHVAENEGAYRDVLGFIRKEGIGDVQSEAQLRARVAGWRRELRDQRTLANGTGAGMILGTGMAFADVSSLIPVVGVAGKAGTALKVARMGLYGGAITAGQEAGLQALESDRSARESYMNIGIGTALGGGLGVFGELVAPKTAERLDVRNPEGSTEYTPGHGEGLSDAVVFHPLTPEEYRGEQGIPSHKTQVGVSGQAAGPRVSAAGADAVAAPSRLDTPTTAVGRGARWAGDKLRQVNPNMRALQFKNPTARRLLMPMSGTPVHTDFAARGKGLRSVDEVKDAYKAHLYDLSDQYHRRLKQLRDEMGQGSTAGGEYVRDQADRVAGAFAEMRGQARTASYSAISQDVFTRAIHNRVLRYDDPEFERALVKRYGEDGAAKVRAAADEVAERVHRNNRLVEDKMADLGMIDEADRLGDQYGMAVLYDRQFASAHPQAVRAFLRRKLADSPDEEFLAAHGLDSGRFEALGQREVSIADEAAEGGVRTIDPAEGAAIKDELLADWAGTSKDNELAQLEAELEQAKARHLSAKADALDAYHALRTHTSGRRKADLSLAREYARQGVRKQQRYERFMRQAADERRYVSDRLTQLGAEGKERTRLAGRLDELDTQMQKAEAKLGKLNAQIRQAQLDIERAEKTATEAADLEKRAKTLRRELKDEARKAGTEAKRAGRRLKKAEQTKTANDVVEELLDAIRGGQGEETVAAPDALLAETGRTKRRRIHWTSAERQEGERLGLIRSDTWAVLTRQYEELSGAIALREVYGNEAAGLSDSAFYQSLRDTLGQSYDDLVEAARAQGDEKAAGRWLSEKRTAEGDLENYLAYHLGRLGRPKNPDSLLYWLSAQARKLNLQRYGLGFGISSLPDVATMILTVGRALFSAPMLRHTWKLVRGLDDHEVRMLSVGSELYHLNRGAAYGQANLDTVAGAAGVGPYGSLKNRVTSRIGRAMDWNNQQITVASGMAAWNGYGKTIAGLVQMRKLYDAVMDYAALYERAGFHQVDEHGQPHDPTGGGDAYWRHRDSEAALTIGQLSSVGIGAHEAATLAERFRKFDIKPDAEGIVSPELHRWFDEGDTADADAAHLLRAALFAAQNRAIPTPGAGDRPFLMSDAMAGTLFQFQSYGFVACSKALSPMAQRLTYYGDMDAYLAMMAAITTGLMVTIAKDGGHDGQRDIRQIAYDAFDRGGFLGFLSPYASATGNILGGSGGSRYGSVSTLGQLMGPTFGLAADAATAAGTAAEATQGEASASAVWEKSRRLMPYQQIWRLSDLALADQHE